MRRCDMARTKLFQKYWGLFGDGRGVLGGSGKAFKSYERQQIFQGVALSRWERIHEALKRKSLKEA